MKANYRTANGRITFEVQGETPKDLFSQISSLQEVFEAESTCGVCKSSNIRFQHRKVEDFDYYELSCLEPGCRARFAFGQAKKGGALFPKRKDPDGHWLPNRGWEKYQPKTTSAAVPGNSRASEPPPFGPPDDDVPF